MTWVADQSANRTYDPFAGLELFFVSGGSDGSQSLEIRGKNFILPFSASTIEAPVTAEELVVRGLSDAGVWCVWGKATQWSAEQQSLIVAALCATKGGHGFTATGVPYFVRFGYKGELRNA